MDIRLLSFLQPSQLGVKSVAALLAQLQPGQQVAAVVETQLAENSFLLKLGDNGPGLRAQTLLKLLPGQTLTLEVTRTGATPELKVLPPTDQTPSVATSTIQQALREFLPKQQSVSGLMTTLSQLIGLPQPDEKALSALPEPIRNAIQSTMDALPHKNELLNADGLKRAVANSGVFFEAKMLTMDPKGKLSALPKDLKAVLLNLNQSLQPSSAETKSVALSVVPLRNSPGPAAPTQKLPAQAAASRQEPPASVNIRAPLSPDITSLPAPLTRNSIPETLIEQTKTSLSLIVPAPAPASDPAPPADPTSAAPTSPSVVTEPATGDKTPQQPTQRLPSANTALAPRTSRNQNAPPTPEKIHLSDIGQPTVDEASLLAEESELKPIEERDLGKVRVDTPTGMVARPVANIKSNTLESPIPPDTIPVELPDSVESQNPFQRSTVPKTLAHEHEQIPVPQHATEEASPENRLNAKSTPPPPMHEKALREFIQTQNSNGPIFDQPASELKALHHHTEGALARIVLDQLASLPTNDGKLMNWQLEIPFTDGRFVGAANLKIVKDSSSPGTGIEQAFWSVIVEISPPGLGAIHSRISLHGDQVSTYFWADEATTTERIHADLDKLSARLKQAGLEIGQIATLPGAPADTAKMLPTLASKLLDERA